MMAKTALHLLHEELNNEFATRQRLGGYNADASSILLLTKSAMLMARYLLDADKEIAKLKREVARLSKGKKK